MRGSWLLACGLVLVSAGCEVEPNLDDDFVATVEDLSGGLIDLGDFGLDGDVAVRSDEDRNVRVAIDVDGLDPSGTYVLALHGLDSLDAPAECPELAAADLDGDGELSIDEVEAFAGGQLYVVDTDLGADDAGGLRQELDLVLSPSDFDAFSPLEDRVLVLYHGGADDPLPVGCFDLSAVLDVQPISGATPIGSAPLDVNGATVWPRFPEYQDQSLER